MAWSWQKKASEKKPVEQQATPAAKKNYVPMIVAAAKKHGVPVSQALKVAKAEGGLDQWIRARGRNKAGQLEPSYGPFQALVGGGDTGFTTGLGNEMLKRGIDPRTDAQAEEYFDVVMETVANEGWGQWRGADQFSFGGRKASKGRAHASGGVIPSGSDEPDFSGMDLATGEDEPLIGTDVAIDTTEDPLEKEEKTLGDIMSGALGDSWLDVPEIDIEGMAAQRKEDILAMMLGGMEKAQTGSLPMLPGFPMAGS